jgi:hypothetical protein
MYSINCVERATGSAITLGIDQVSPISSFLGKIRNHTKVGHDLSQLTTHPASPQ